ncbi:peptide chain release factor N(5)-glutamine methyltransferase [Candidatus Similichlamydia epinepheli]|uniref:peptide chain release factor N(5)-glutamine methyltransferase n=1 Tax=Candidatus Similichlamydia epinepheli TaxID=1903953 RepID=UPI000D337FE3|nr:peptide chain release factor N(5)-glutamine methyltransferase [Candidatus Similichlamydia epinepheli]
MLEVEKLSVKELLNKWRFAAKQIGQTAIDIDWFFCRKFDYSCLSDLYFNEDKFLDKRFVCELEFDLKRLIEGCPLEYVLGECFFDGEWIQVHSSTLIPRQETEELLRHIPWGHIPYDGRYLDLGCGSGCLALSMKKIMSNAIVCASDICSLALDVAHRNAKLLLRDIIFREGSWFSPWEGELFDLIVSNPPYLGEEEWINIDRSVKDFEPKKALVSGATGLEHLTIILQQAQSYLVKRGHLVLEIGYLQCKEVERIARRFGWFSVKSQRDSFGKDRFLILSCD